jgi:exonuclease SbcC
MKILKLRFKNLNSLENEHAIHFDEAPFSDTGVFAITGANGSGKSTILDAITLALFGETFRFNRPASHVMTKHTQDCYAEVEFALADQKYLSSWSVRRNAGDPESELQACEMKLMRLSGEPELLADTPSQVLAKINEVTGMNFRNFTRSILLAQGDFAAFLNALDSERIDILEKIVSADIYQDYQKEILEKAETASKKLDLIKRDLSALRLLDPLTREAYEHDLIDFKEQYAEYQQQQTQLQQQHSKLSAIKTLTSRIAEQEAGLKKIIAEAEIEQAKLTNLEAGQHALDFKDELAALRQAQETLKQHEQALASLNAELKQLQSMLVSVSGNQPAAENLADLSFAEQQQTIASTRSQVNLLNSNRYAALQLAQSLTQQSKEKAAQQQDASAWLEAHAADQSLIDHFPEIARLKGLQQTIKELSEKQKVFTKWSAKAALTQKKNSEAFDKQEKQSLSLSQRLEQEESNFSDLSQGKTMEELQDLLSEQRERVTSIRKLIRIAEVHQKLAGDTGFWSLFKSKQAPAHDVSVLHAQIEQLKLDLKREENIRLLLEEKIHLEQILTHMSAYRHELRNGKPCPLCGGLEHPYAKNPPVQTFSQLTLADQHAKIKDTKIKIATLEKTIVLAEKQAESDRATQLKLTQLASQWLTLVNRLNIANRDLEINDRKSMKQLLKDEVIELAEISSLISNYRKSQKRSGKLTQAISKTSTSIERLQVGGQQMDVEWQSRSAQQNENDAALVACQQEEQQLHQQVLAQLTLLGETMPAKGAEQALLERLNLRLQEYQVYLTRQQNLTSELAQWSEKEQQCQAEIKHCDSQLAIYNQQLQSHETLGLHLALIEKQKLIAEKELAIAEQDTACQRLQQLLQDKLPGRGFNDLQQLEAMLVLLETRSDLQRRKAELDQTIQLKTHELEQNQAQVTLEKAQLAPDLTLEEVTAHLRGLHEKTDIAYREGTRLEKLLNEQVHVQQQYETLAAQLKNQEAETQLCMADKALLTADNGMVFRRRVQKEIADRLLTNTNAVLEKISGRYYLRQAVSEQGLALEIEDTYQGNARRPPKSLSGGESFVVSLALALGLSELVNNGKSIDSLFLDEGFGNLDAETLYTVISTLESLHTHGKTVGVISHVEAVQKRIKAQLQVIKKPNGVSVLKKAS